MVGCNVRVLAQADGSDEEAKVEFTQGTQPGQRALIVRHFAAHFKDLRARDVPAAACI